MEAHVYGFGTFCLVTLLITPSAVVLCVCSGIHGCGLPISLKKIHVDGFVCVGIEADGEFKHHTGAVSPGG